MKKIIKYFSIMFILIFVISFSACSCKRKGKPIMSFDETQFTLMVDENLQLQPKLTDSDVSVTYASSNEECVTVTKDGLVTAVKVGTANIIVTCNKEEIQIIITVKEKPVTISFVNSNVTIQIGEKFLMELNKPEVDNLPVVYESSNTNVVTINKYGRITGVSVGTATVTAKVKDAVATAIITVKEIPLIKITYNLNYYTDQQLTDKIYLTDDITSGTTPIKPGDPIRENFIFDGWYLDNTGRNKFDFDQTKLVADTVLYAKWHLANYYTISFDQTSTNMMESMVYQEGSDLSLFKPANPTKLGYIFTGWYKDSNLTERFDFNESVVNSSIKLFAGWEKDPTVVIVTYYVNGEVYQQTLEDIYSKIEELEYTGSDADEFTAWTDDRGNIFNFNKNITEDINLYAKFSLKLGAGQTIIEDAQFEGDTSLVDVEIADTITELGSGAFADCINIKTIVIPASVTAISIDCFKGCESLTSITYLGNEIIAIGERAFFGCTSLTELNIPSTVTTIGSEAFAYCSNLTKVELPEGLITLGDGTFMGCTKLKTINFPPNIKVVEKNLFRGCIALELELPETIEVVKAYGFYNTNIYGKLTANVKEYGEYAFYSCQGLTEVTISKDVESIGDYTFYNCINITHVDFEKNDDGTANLKTIGVASFAAMTKLEEVILPEGMTGILDDSFRYTWGAFAGNTSLKKVYIPSTIRQFGVEGGNGSAMFYNCTSLTDVTIGDGITTLGTHMFHDCKSLETIDIPSSVEVMGGYIFSGCINLTTITFGENSILRSIPTYGFRDCKSLTNIQIPDTVTTMYSNAFANCEKLSRINSNVEGEFVLPKNISLFSGTGIFSNCASLVNITIESDKGNIEFDKYATSMFRGCSSLRSVIFDENLSINIIPAEMFSGCSSLELIVLPKNITQISRDAFRDCKSLQEFTLPNTVTVLGDNSVNQRGIFSGCTSLDTFIFEEGSNLKHIPIYAFYECSSLRNIVIPDSVETIGKYAFEKTGLVEFGVKSSNSNLNEIGEYAFSESKNLKRVNVYNTVTIYNSGAFSYCTSLNTLGQTEGLIELGSSIEFIESIFSNCISIKKVKLDCNKITELPSGFFINCESLESINSDEVGTYIIPEWITRINATVFRYNYKVKKIQFMGNINYFGLYSMDSCNSLTSIYLYKNVTKADEVPIANLCFSKSEVLNSLGFKVYVPTSSLTFYQNDDTWNANGYTKYLTTF